MTYLAEDMPDFISLKISYLDFIYH